MAKLISIKDETVIRLNKAKVKYLQDTNYGKNVSNDVIVNIALIKYLGE